MRRAQRPFAMPPPLSVWPRDLPRTRLKADACERYRETIEKRVQTASSDDEAIPTAKENLYFSAPPTASGFSLMRQDGKEIYRWFKAEARPAPMDKPVLPCSQGLIVNAG